MTIATGHRDVDKGLSANPRDRQNRHGRRRSRAPNHTGLHQLRVAETVKRGMHRGLHQDALYRVIHLRRDEVDLGGLDRLSGAGHDLDRQPHLNAAGEIGRDVNVGFQVLVLVHRGQQRCR